MQEVARYRYVGVDCAAVVIADRQYFRHVHMPNGHYVIQFSCVTDCTLCTLFLTTASSTELP